MAAQNYQRRQFEVFSSNVILDTGNPSMGYNGANVYGLYANTDAGDVSFSGLAQGGLYKLYNDRTIEIIGGQKSEETGVDICITGKNGDVWITAMKNGQVRIRGANIVVDADENLTLKAGNNSKIKAGNKLDLKATIANCDAKEGNLVDKGIAFMGQSFAGTYVYDEAISLVGKSLTGGLL